MKVSAQYAEAHFPDVYQAAEKGEEIVIERPGGPSLVLIPQATSKPDLESATAPQDARRRLITSWEGPATILSNEDCKAALDRKLATERPSLYPSAEARRARKKMRGAGIGKIWLSPDAFTPEADAEILQMFDDEVERNDLR
jgi:antitoxin (DNA-binding transcriptional repressor) of toxin-antitoxin stability system